MEQRNHLGKEWGGMPEFTHRPVLLEECMEALNIRPDGIYLDGTLGLSLIHI